MSVREYFERYQQLTSVEQTKDTLIEVSLRMVFAQLSGFFVLTPYSLVRN